MGGVRVDPRLASALERQLEGWHAALDAGARRVGWKLGVGDEERIGPGPVIGHLTSASVLQSGDTYRSQDDDLRADAEVAVELGPDLQISGYAAAVELVGGPWTGTAEQFVTTNVFHRAVAFGPFRPTYVDVHGAIVVNGETRDRAAATGRYEQLVERVGEVLDAVGESLLPGDRIITGNIVQVPVRAGDQVTADLEALGGATVRVA